MSLCVLFSQIIASAKATPFAISVAYAAPATPHLKIATNRMTRIIFTRVAIIRKYNGVFESPRPRSTALVPLKPKKITFPDR